MGLKQSETANTGTTNEPMLQKLARQKCSVTARRLPENWGTLWQSYATSASSETGRRAVPESAVEQIWKFSLAKISLSIKKKEKKSPFCAALEA